MKNSINSKHIATHISEELFADNEVSKARLQLAFIGTLFVSTWIIGSMRMGEAIVSTHGVPLIGTLLGM